MAVACLFFLLAADQGLAADTNQATNARPALADLSIEELMKVQVPSVVGASKHEQKTTEAPASVTVITADDIKKYGYRTLADILRSTPGFFITYDRSYGYVGVRGFNLLGDYGGRVLLLVDGHRLNDPIYDTVASMTDFILDVDLIERVELIKGPGSSLYGNNALFAVINIVTRRGRDFEGHGAEASGSAGSYDTYQGRASYGHRFSNDVEVVVSGTAFDSRGNPRLFLKEFDDPSTHNGVARNLDDDQFHSVFGHASWKDLSLEAACVTRDKQAPTALYGTLFDDPHFTTTDERGFAELKYMHEFPDLGAVMARVYYDRYDYHADYPFNGVIPSDPAAVVINRDNQIAEWVGAEVQWSRTFWERHRLTLGAEYDDYFDLEMKNFDLNPRAVYGHSDRTQLSAGVYAQDEYRVLDNLVLNAGVRFDYFYGFNRFDPRAAVVWDPREGTTLKLIYGTAFRAPNEYERYYVTNVNLQNPNLKPETVADYELIWEQAIGQFLRASVAGFYMRVEDLISQQRDSSGVVSFTNVSGADSKGADLALSGAWRNGLRGRVSYTFAEADDLESGERLHNSPQHLAKLNLIVPVVKEKLFAGMEVQYTSARGTLGGSSVGDFWVANLTLFSQKLIKGWEASASVYNLFDHHYRDPSSDFPDIIPQDGRTFRVKLMYRF